MTTLDLLPTRPFVPSRLTVSPSERDDWAARARHARLWGRVFATAPLLGVVAGGGLAWGHGLRRPLGLGALGVSLGLAALRWQLRRFFTENAPYELQATLGDIELRSYPAQVRAETMVQAPWHDALREGFQRLAAYISGANISGERLRMTAPVLARFGASGAVDSHTVMFVMPIERRLRELPVPRDRRVWLRPVPEHLAAALRFSGNYDRRAPEEQRALLLQRLREARIGALGAVTFAAYDAPFTVPRLRRNELLVDLDDT